MRRLLEAGRTISDITHIFISHFHTDHTGELASFLFSTKYPETLRRQLDRYLAEGRTAPSNAPSELRALICPHAGCTIELKDVPDEKTGSKAPGYACPCHKAYFDLTGKRLQAASPSPRDLDQLEVEVRNGNEVWVKFQNYKLGTPDKVAVA